MPSTMGFIDFKEFLDAVGRGFLDASSYRDARKKGFTRASSYFDAIGKGFDNLEEYTKAKELGIQSRWEYDLFRILNMIRKEYPQLETMEEAHIIKVLREFPIGTSVPLEEILKRLRSEQDKLLNQFIRWKKNWYGRPQITTNVEKLEEFIATMDFIQRLGNYDPELRVFIRILPGGFVSEEEYKDAISKGYTTREEYLDAKSKGFIGSFDKLKSAEPFKIFEFVPNYLKAQAHDKDIGEICKIKSGKIGEWKSLTLNTIGIFNEADLYKYAIKKGFNSFNEFFEAIGMGTLEYENYINAKKRQIQRYSRVFSISKLLGYSTRQELIKSIYDDYESLKKLKDEYKLKTYKDALVFRLLKTFQQKKQSINLDGLWKIVKECEYTYFNRGSLWFRLGRKSGDYRTFKNKEELESYLIGLLRKHPELGTYDKESKIFKPKLPPVIVDGSNVARHREERGEEVLAKKIELVIEKLKELGYTEIYVFVDANLKYKVRDRKTLEKLINEKIVEEMPAGTQADDFIIKYARDMDAFIVTNDKYSEWIKKNPRLKDFIFTHRVTFSIVDGIVHFDEKIEGI